MAITSVCEATRKIIVHYPDEFDDGRTRCAALAPYATPIALLAALGPASALCPDERGAVIAAIVAERRAQHPLWQGLLLLAFEPMLRRLRAGLGNVAGDEADRDQLVLLAFFEALRTVSVPAKAALVPLALLRGTKHALRASVHRMGDPGAHAFDAVAAGWDPGATGVEEPTVSGAVAEIGRMLAVRDDDGLRVVLATCAYGASLEDYVLAAHPDWPAAARARACERLRKARERTLARLRDRLAAYRSAA